MERESFGARRRHRCRALGLWGTLLGACGPAPAAKPAEEASTLAAPAPSLPDDVSAVDFTALREEYARRDDFSARCEDQRPLKQWIAWLEAGSWSELLESAEQWTEQCAIDIDAHFMVAVSHDKLGHVAPAGRGLACVKGLVASIARSGDGRTAETAFHVVSVPEEYSFMRIIGLQPKGQAHAGGTIDEFVVERDGREGKLFFDATPHFERLRKRFGLEAP